MIYIQTRCSKCDYLIRPYSRETRSDMEKFGIPFTVCPKCKTILRNRHKEYAMMNNFDIFRYYITPAIYGIFCGFFVGGIIGHLFFKENRIAYISSILLGALLFEILFLRNCNKNFLEERDKSIERTRDKEYLDTLLYLNFINEEQYQKFLNTYGVMDNAIKDVSLKRKALSSGKKKAIKPSEYKLDSKYNNLEKLKELYDKNVITKSEFEKEKEKILNE